MKQANPLWQRLLAVSLLGFALLSFPLLGLPLGHWFALPAPYLYIFGVWAGLIVLAAWLGERRGD